MLPEERELARLEAEQAKLEEQLASAELELETLKTETARFRHRYYGVLGRLYAQLDEIEAKIAKLRMQQAPQDSSLKAHAQAAEQKSKESAEEAGLMDAEPEPALIVSAGLKHAYRQAVKLLHPDLATTERERERRTKLMAALNLAYERGDQEGIAKLIGESEIDPDAILGQDIGSRIVRTIRRLAQLRRRLIVVQEEMKTQQSMEIFLLKQIVEKAEASGDDPLGDLQRKLKRQISESKIRFEAMQARNV